MHWHSLNQLTIFGMSPTLERTNEAHSGTFAVVLTSKEKSGLGAFPGVISSGPLLDAQWSPDFSQVKLPYTYRPTKFRYYYKADPEPGDSSQIEILLTRFNVALQQIDTVGIAMAGYGDSTAGWVMADLDITYLLPFSPDSIMIIASSSYDPFNPGIGSKFWLDDMSLVGGSNALSDAVGSVFANIWPNPAQDYCYISAEQEIASIQLFDISGRTCKTIKVNGKSIRIAVGDLPSGHYTIALTTRSGESIRRPLVVGH